MTTKKEIARDKNLEELMELADQQSRGYFRQGLNCAECVVRTFMDIYETGMPEEVICMATGFGGGMGHTKNTCGAITGSVMALGMTEGRRDPFGPKEEMQMRIKHLQGDIYPVFEKLIKEIEAEYGTLICREMSKQYDDFDSKPRMKNCMEIIAYCARTVIRHAEAE
ncbi:MAG: C_GCAxxG_C_C family protein [Firmicutes bacterium]|nr:C_GCAxxG_C_C family protein [Bacillota bacterium]